MKLIQPPNTCLYNVGNLIVTNKHPANIYLFKVVMKTLEKGVKYVQS